MILTLDRRMWLDMRLGKARRDNSEAPQTGLARPVACFDWLGCAAHLDIANRVLVARVERFLALAAHHQNQPPENSCDSVVSVLSKDGGALVCTSAWRAWAAGQDEAIYLILEALGQVFVDAYAGTVFHGTAVDLGRGALVIHGPALSGKTTLAYRAWRRGFSVISDDRVAIETDCRTVRPFPRCLKLRCADDEELAAIAEGIPPDFMVSATIGAERRVVLARSLPGFAPYGDTRPIRALIQLERTTGKTRLEPIEPSAALEIALRNIVASDFNPTAVVRLIKSQAEHGGLYRLAIGVDQSDAALDLLSRL